MNSAVTVRAADAAELAAAARHYHAMRRDLDWPDDALLPDWEQRFVRFHARGAAAGELRYFVAKVGNELVGSAVALVVKPLSHEFLKSASRGFLANVYVEEPWRRRGIARALTTAAVDWLRSVGCTAVRLHASEFGRPLYESMGFVAGSEMVLPLGNGAGEFE